MVVAFLLLLVAVVIVIIIIVGLEQTQTLRMLSSWRVRCSGLGLGAKKESLRTEDYIKLYVNPLLLCVQASQIVSR